MVLANPTYFVSCRTINLSHSPAVRAGCRTMVYCHMHHTLSGSLILTRRLLTFLRLLLFPPLFLLPSPHYKDACQNNTQYTKGRACARRKLHTYTRVPTHAHIDTHTRTHTHTHTYLHVGAGLVLHTPPVAVVLSTLDTDGATNKCVECRCTIGTS